MYYDTVCQQLLVKLLQESLPKNFKIRHVLRLVIYEYPMRQIFNLWLCLNLIVGSKGEENIGLDLTKGE